MKVLLNDTKFNILGLNYLICHVQIVFSIFTIIRRILNAEKRIVKLRIQTPAVTH